MKISTTAFLAFALGLYCPHALTDSLGKLPPEWQQQLVPVLTVDLTPLKPDEQQAITDGRAKVDELLSGEKPDPEQLASAYGRLGNRYLSHSLYTSAESCYVNALRLKPDYFPWMYYSAYLAHQDGDLQLALSRYGKARAVDPGYVPTAYRLAQVYLDLNQPDEAYSLFNDLLAQQGYEAAAHAGLGQVHLMQQSYDEAVQQLSRALELDPEATRLHYPLAMALRSTGKTEQAKQHLKRFGKQELKINDRLVDALQALRNPASLHFAQAMTNVTKKDYAAAAAEFESGLEYEPDNTSAKTSYARVLYLKHDKENARIQLTQVLEKDPNKTLALFLLGLLDDESGNIDEAGKRYRQVIELDPDHEGAHFFLGNIYLHRGEYKNALSHFEAATANNQKNLPAMVFQLAAMMGSSSSDTALLTHVNKITDRAPNMISMKRVQILLLSLSDEKQVRDSSLARKLAEQMYQQHKLPVNLELLALATAADGNFDRAEQQMRDALAKEKQYENSRNVGRISRNLEMLQRKQLPKLDWQDEVKYMLPPPTRALVTFRDYPDPNPI